MFTEFLSKIGKTGKICVKTNSKRCVKMPIRNCGGLGTSIGFACLRREDCLLVVDDEQGTALITFQCLNGGLDKEQPRFEVLIVTEFYLYTVLVVEDDVKAVGKIHGGDAAVNVRCLDGIKKCGEK